MLIFLWVLMMAFGLTDSVGGEVFHPLIYSFEMRLRNLMWVDMGNGSISSSCDEESSESMVLWLFMSDYSSEMSIIYFIVPIGFSSDIYFCNVLSLFYVFLVGGRIFSVFYVAGPGIIIDSCSI